jgi:putative aldouronate transport system permease protein
MKNRKPERAGKRKYFKNDAALHIMVALPVLCLFIYSYIPMAGGFVIAFQRYRPALGMFRSSWVGLYNFNMLFSTSGFREALWNTISISVQKIVCLTFAAVSFSLLLNEMGNLTVKRTIQTIVYLPHFISWIIMSAIIIQILSPVNGIVNQYLGYLGIQPVFFLGDNRWFQPTLIITSVWKNFGYSTIVYLAALAGVDPNLHEAAMIDGAGHWKRMIHVTLPCIVPTIILMTTLQMGSILSAGFDQVYNLLSSATMKSGDILDTLVYRYGMLNMQFSLATAAGLFKSVVSTVLIILSYRLAYKFSGYRIF